MGAFVAVLALFAFGGVYLQQFAERNTKATSPEELFANGDGYDELNEVLRTLHFRLRRSLFTRSDSSVSLVFPSRIHLLMQRWSKVALQEHSLEVPQNMGRSDGYEDGRRHLRYCESST